MFDALHLTLLIGPLPVPIPAPLPVTEALRSGAIRSGQLPPQTQAVVMATVFDSFLQGVSILARDDVPHAVIDAAITQLLVTWDVAASVVAPHIERC